MKLLSQLFGDQAVVANATSCSSIYGSSLPTTTPWRRQQGRPRAAWCFNLFEDNAEFGLGFRLTSTSRANSPPSWYTTIGMYWAANWRTRC